MSTLAPELMDLILSHLHPLSTTPGKSDHVLDKEAAHNVGKCALLCKAWMPRSRRILFYRLSIRKGTAHRLARLFRKPERLTFLPFIRVLELCGGLVQDRWMVTVFPKISKYLPPSITTLLLRYDFYNSSFVKAFPQLDVRGLTHLQIDGLKTPDMGDVVQFVASLPVLLSLQLWPRSEDWSDTPLVESVASLRAPATMQHLDFTYSELTPFLEWIQASDIPLSSLRIHHMAMQSRWPQPSESIQAPEFQSALRLIESLAPSLTSLSLTLDSYYTAIPVDDSFLRSHTILKELSIHAASVQTEALFHTRFPPSLESLRLKIPYYSRNAGWFGPLRLPAWSSLDSRLASAASLRRLHIEHEGAVAEVPLEFDEICAGMEGILPLCAARGILTQSVVPRS
ncbi:hypothetical protein FB45DRAFT_922800 [Roridomyces roridus]|uniref:F-box domain-containing protein n=1 Tax=Roridomyces roridus TaxID=1738132 RepID=A0AAD7BNP2_9AGAR|nr:hypothetical protein FB45DRAFT_922800 [Roridomyces roridus]